MTVVEALQGAKQLLIEQGRTTGTLRNDEGEHCLYGALVVAAGIPLARLEYGDWVTRDDADSEAYPLAQKVALVFMNGNGLRSAIDFNDSLPPSPENDAKVLAAFDKAIAYAGQQG